MKAYIASVWNTGSRNDMAVAKAYPLAGVSYTDITGQLDANLPPSPNLLIVLAEGLSSAQLATIDADSAYAVIATDADPGEGVPVTKSPDSQPTTLEMTTQSTWFTTKGMLSATVSSLISTGKTRRQNAIALRDHLATRPKG